MILLQLKNTEKNRQWFDYNNYKFNISFFHQEPSTIILKGL